MRRLTDILLLVTWALWFGGLMALFVFVKALFNHDHDIAVQAAPQLFLAFQKYHLALAAIALVTTVLKRILGGSKSSIVLFVLFAAAACAGVVIAIWFVGPMETLRLNGLSQSAQFKRLHGESMILYLAQAILLLICGIILPCALRGKTSRQIVPALNSPA